MNIFLKTAVIFLAMCAPALAQTREIRLINATAVIGQTVNVSIELVAQGNENALGFSLNFNQAIFSNPVVTLGSGATGAVLNANTAQAANGRIGIVLALPATQTFAAGVRQVVSIAFSVAANAPAGATTITFGDQPVTREVADANASSLTTTFTPGTITVTQPATAQIVISPANPTASDTISIRLSGVWPDSCAPQNPQLSVMGTDLRIDTSNSGQACLTVLTNWSLSVAVGTLPAANYTVRVIHTAGGVQQNLGQLTFTVAGTLASVSAASFLGDLIAAESIVAAFGSGLATGTEAALTIPLPTMLAGTRVLVRDSEGTERPAPLFYASPMQINYLMPPGTAAGVATVTVTSGDNKISIGAPQIANVAPGLFAANANGRGVAAANILRAKQNGEQVYEVISRFDSAQNGFVPIPIEFGPEGEELFLILYGTGFKFRGSLSAVSVKIGGTDVEMTFAGPVEGFAGLDQCNVRLPRSLAGRGEVDVVMMVEGKVTNMLRANFK